MANDTSAEEASSLHSLQWDPESLIDSLDKLYRLTTHEAEQSIAWYRINSRPKKRWAQIIRVTAIVATSLGGIIPILSQIVSEVDESLRILFNPAWASVAIALAATALGLDRFFGFSTAWMRFITSEMQIKAKLQAFQFEWEVERMSWRGSAPSYKQARTMMLRCATLATEVSNIVQAETLTWVEEFQGALKTLDERSKTQAESAQRGAVKVTIENGDQCEAGWTLSVAGKDAEIHYGKTGVISNIYPGIHKITIQGLIQEKSVQAESVVQVFPGEIATVDLTLA